MKYLFIYFSLCCVATYAQEPQKYFALTYTVGSQWDPDRAPNEQPYFKEHSKYLSELRKEGKIAIGARYADIGLVILKVRDEHEANAILAGDLSVEHGTFNASIHPFNPFYAGSVMTGNENKELIKNAIQNFQIPVKDYERAHTFYSSLMGYELEKMERQGVKLGIFRFAGQEESVGGMIIKSEGSSPSKSGTLVYLETGHDLQPYLDRVLPNGGTVVVEKTALGPDMGYFALFDDTEGNRVGLYSKH